MVDFVQQDDNHDNGIKDPSARRWLFLIVRKSKIIFDVRKILSLFCKIQL